MWPFDRSGSKKSYRPVQTDDVEDDQNSFDFDDGQYTAPKSKRKGLVTTFAGFAGVAFIVLFLIVFGIFLTSHNDRSQTSTEGIPTDPSSPSTEIPSGSAPSSDTTHCTLRREWRTLETSGKHEYIRAVQCLLKQPSQLQPPHNLTANSTLYTDFPFIHARIGYRTHNSAPFLPWHRYFLHLYETALREKCGYTGGLVYWDWTLDAADLTKSPVFDPETGFGGDGDSDLPITLGRSGRCVTNGPFGAGPDGVGVWGQFYDVKFLPHCLSRGFRDDQGNLGTIDGSTVTAESIGEVLDIEGYEDFVTTLEGRVHDAIPFGVAGDFETFTAPYDPLFYLHHTQLDRLWYIWQQRNPERVMEYSGHEGRHSIESAKLTDKIKMGGWAEEIEVRQVMDTEGATKSDDGQALLCYRH
ncbi:hypothetical protein LTR10_016647 [Elasticomyces elasticus]|uniref:Tyrosinase copper-binding domain-containing protein n=1 Tax=Exophiala sideris TaxID=1016849 RepID=A0ABR0JJU7_9EURO|nr:hypothetical protein LTR10_016647 [Elasticomyces elasticus]KAK5035293.1 hypothetical protein LTS07_002729 [Exophiala sideris]KAK5039355.1 hypothetical protein LTR13_003612 [Exophiala sideris]KAK5066217.1 hypothetical protein LTR69_002735 [Exophiala sideris]KAK5186894.1 hypothetical protein LTR44_000900 [Eurotiomycetes sp. CCFEE 6388]